MNISSYKLVKASGGIFHYAEVTTESVASPAGGFVRVSPEAFAWLKEVYGPNAWEWPECEGYRQAAIRGAEYALTHSSPTIDRTNVGIVIKKIDASPVDTSDSSVAFASCYATWRVLNLAAANEPRFDGKKIIFPE